MNVPEIDELVVATVESTTQFGAYLRLEDYQLKAFLPISEVSSKWIRRVSDVIRTGERTVVKVIRVDERTGNIDVSLKDVPPSERRSILAEWEKNKRGRSILKTFSEKTGVDLEKLLDKLSNLIERSPTVYEALERIVIGPEILKELSFSRELQKNLYQFLRKRISPREYVFKAVISVACKDTGGVYKIRRFFEKVRDEATSKKLKTKITLIGAPRYLVKLSSYKPGTVRREAPQIVDRALKYAERIRVSCKVLEKGLEK